MEALIVNGVYGSGKTTMVEEMAEKLEHLGRSFGAIDLDWLKWFFVPDLVEEAAAQVGLANLADVRSGTQSRAGVEYLLMAGTFADAST